MNVATRGFRNTFRNTTRTVSIVIILGLSIGLSLVMLIAHQAVENKIKSTLSTIGTTVSISPAGFMASSSVNNALTDAQLNTLRHIAHITKVTGQLTDHVQTDGTIGLPLPGMGQGTSNSTSLESPVKLDSKGSAGGLFISRAGGAAPRLPANFSPPIPIIGTNDPADPSAIGAASLRIVSGKAMSGSRDVSDAMISTDMAKKNNLKVGSAFTAYTQSFTVVALFDTGNVGSNDNIIVPLPTEQRLSDNKNDVTGITATVDSLTNLSVTTSAIKKALGSSADVVSNLDQANQALQPLNSVKNISLYSLFGSIVAAGVIILLTMIMIVRERRREIGTLKAIGSSNTRIMLQFMTEATTFTLLGTVVGLVIGVFGGRPVTATLVNNSGGGTTQAPLPTSGGTVNIIGGPQFANIRDVHAQIGWTIILYGIGAAIFIALIGSALASYIVSKVRPAEVLRSE